MVQIIAAFTTLLSHRSDLTGRWGYASYHLTVIPYLFMTLVNLVSNLIIADYPCLYMVRTDTMTEAERSGGIFEAEVAQTVTLIDEDDDLVEDIPYGGVTIENIISFTTHLTQGGMISWYLTASEYVSTFSIRGQRHARPGSPLCYKSVPIDLHICEGTRVHNSQQLPIDFESSPTTSDGQIDLTLGDSNGRERIGPAHLEDGHGIETHSARGSYSDSQPESNYVNGFSSSHEYLIRFHEPPRPFTPSGVAGMLRSAMCDRIERTRGLALARGYSLDTWQRWYLWGLLASDVTTLVPQASSRDLHSTERESTPASAATFYYPGCAKFLRSSSPNHHTRSHIETMASNDHPSALSTEPHANSSETKRGSHTRTGVFLEILVGLLLVGLFFVAVAALTQFQANQSSKTERGVTMAWLASGLYGCCLPFMSTSELVKIFYHLPMLSVYGDLDRSSPRSSFKQSIQMFWTKPKDQLVKLYYEAVWDIAYNPGGLYMVLSFVPFAIFIPPVWGFVLVGRMLIQWGDCTRLY